MTFGAAFPRVMRPAFGPGLASATAASWWLAGGATGAVAVYQPIGAASLAASYVNLASPGTYDATVGVAPTFDAATGWTFNGSTQYLTTGITTATGAWSALVRFANARTTLSAQGANTLMGGVNVSGGVKRFYLVNARREGVTDRGVEYGIGSGNENDGYFRTAPSIASGVLAMAGAYGYRNGVVDTAASTTNVGTTQNISIGALMLDGAPYATFFGLADVLAVAIYNTILTAPQVSAVSAAMAALTG